MKKLLVSCLLSLITAFNVVAATLNANTSKTITADKIHYNIKSESIKTTGQTQIKSADGTSLLLNNASLSGNGTSAMGDDIELNLGRGVYVSADNIVRENERTIATDALFTACYDCDDFGNAWEITTNKIKHNNNNHMIQFYNPVFWIYDLPLFWFPYFDMPDPTIKHKSGVLVPNVNSTNGMGTQINLPLYLALSDTHDATFTLSYLTDENPLFQGEHRLNLDRAEFRTNGSFTRNRNDENRWHIFNNDVIELGENARATIFLERASDKTYLQKYGFYEDQPYLDSGARIDLFGQSGYITADAHMFQELRSTRGMDLVANGDILPNIRGTYRTDTFFYETFADFNADVLGVSGTDVASQRLIGNARVVSPWTLWGGNRLTTSISTRYDIYNFNNTEMTDAAIYSGIKSRFLPSGYIEWGLPLVKHGWFAEQNPSDEGWTQIIEPRARITIMRELNNSVFALNNDSAGALLSDATLFSDNRFSGLDLWENGTFADYGVRWAAFDSTGQNIEVFVGESYDFNTKNDTDPNSGFHNGASDYVGRIGYDSGDFIGIASRFRFAQDDLNLRHLETTARFGTSRNYLTTGHIWAAQFIDAETLANDIHELSGGINIYLTNRFGFRFNAIYNITDDMFQRHIGALFYQHPCYFMELGYSRDNARKEDYVGNTTFQFRFGINIDGQKL